MIKRYKTFLLMASLVIFFAVSAARADDVKILAADLYNSNNNNWLVKVTLQHKDSGWDHYADHWQVVDADGNILGDRLLLHPHVNEQPFTRNLTNVQVPDGVSVIYIKAHDKVHGWTGHNLKVDLSKVSDKRLRVEAK